MATNIGPKIGIEGESEYRKQIQSIINDTKVLKSEMNALTSSFDKEKVSVKQNREQKALLQKQIETTQKALAEQEAMLQKAATATDKNGERTAELIEKEKQWQIVVNNTKAELGNLQQKLDEMPSTLELIGQKFTKAGKSMKDFGSKVSDIGGKLTATLTAPIAGLATIGLNYNAQLEQYQTMFTTLTGSAEKADEIITQLQEDASKSPFDTASLVEANQYLISAGVEAEESRETILALGNAIAATGGGSAELSRMAQNLQQVKNIGKASAQDIKQFANAGINIYGLLADATGKTTEEVKDMEVSYEVLAEALAKASEEGGKYYGAMDAQSQTLNGSLSSLKESIQQLLGDITADLLPIIKDVLTRVKEFIDRLKEMDPQQKKMILTIAGIVAAVGPLLTIIGQAIIFAGNIATAIGALGPIIVGVKAAVVAIAGAVSAAIGPILAVIAAIAAVILVVKNWGEISEWLKEKWEICKNAVSIIFDNIKAKASEIFNNMKNTIQNKISDIKSAITSGLSATFNWITSKVSAARSWGSDLVNNIASGIRNAIGSVTSAVKSVANTISSWLHFSEPDIGPLSNFHTWMPDFMKGLADGINQNAYRVDEAIAKVADSLTLEPSSSTNNVNYGGVTVNFIVPEGANGRQLFNEFENEMASNAIRRKAVFG